MRWSYLAVLGFILVGSGWLELFLRTRVLRRWLRLLLTLVPVAIAFSLWDLYAIAAGHWDFDLSRITGVYVVGDLPLDEVLFFLIVPLAAILTFEAVRSVKGWTAGDESPTSTAAQEPPR